MHCLRSVAAGSANWFIGLQSVISRTKSSKYISHHEMKSVRAICRLFKLFLITLTCGQLHCQALLPARIHVFPVTISSLASCLLFISIPTFKVSHVLLASLPSGRCFWWSWDKSGSWSKAYAWSGENGFFKYMVSEKTVILTLISVWFSSCNAFCTFLALALPKK